jgi:hypothetical protein
MKKNVIDKNKYEILMKYTDIDEVTGYKTIYYIIKRRRTRINIKVKDGAIILKRTE